MSKGFYTSVLSMAVAATFAASAANASVVYNVSGPAAGDAEAAEQAFLAGLQDGYVTEDFEGFGAGTQQMSFDTAVGTFTGVTEGAGGSCDNMGFSCDAGLAVLDDATSPFTGRFAMPAGENNNNWLDSMDYRESLFTLNPGYNSVGFFMTDPNDQGGIMDILLGDSTSYTVSIDDIFGGSQPNEGAFYLSFYSDQGIESLTFLSNDPNDGYGIDNVTVGNQSVSVPEPGTIALLGLGLMGMFLAHRGRRQKMPTAA